MSRLFGCLCNEPERLRCALHAAREALVAHDAPNGWGLAFFQGGEVLLQRHPKPLHRPIDFYAVAKDLPADYVIGHVREPGPPNKLENTQPFRFRSWVFAHSGTLGRFPAIQAGMLEHVPDFLRRNIRGQSGSEHLFHLLLAFLHDAGKLDDPALSVADTATALRATSTMLSRLVASAGAEIDSLNLMVTNGRVLLAARHGRSMWMRRVNGIADCGACRELFPPTGVAADHHHYTHEHLRAVIIASEPDKTGPEGWEEVPDASIVGVARDLRVTVESLR